MPCYKCKDSLSSLLNVHCTIQLHTQSYNANRIKTTSLPGDQVKRVFLQPASDEVVKVFVAEVAY